MGWNSPITCPSLASRDRQNWEPTLGVSLSELEPFVTFFCTLASPLNFSPQPARLSGTGSGRSCNCICAGRLHRLLLTRMILEYALCVQKFVCTRSRLCCSNVDSFLAPSIALQPMLERHRAYRAAIIPQAGTYIFSSLCLVHS